MKATQTLYAHGQSLWQDNTTRGMLDSGQIQHCIDGYAVTGLTSNPSISEKAIESGDCDDAIREMIKIPGTAESLPAIIECVASGAPVNVTLLFSVDQYRAAADAYLAGVEGR